jgi:hypothetical protein
VLGLFNATTNELHAAAREASVDAAFVIDTLDAWVATRTRPTVLVLDNARLHHAAAFQARRQDSEDRAGIFSTCRLTAPTSTKSKSSGAKSNYEWLRPEAYADFKTLKTAVWHILDRVGLQLTIQFTT